MNAIAWLSVDGESLAALLIADPQLAAARKYGAQIAFINSGGVRTGLEPAADGTITFGQIFAMQPFGNNPVVKTLTGVQLKRGAQVPRPGAFAI